MAEIIREDTPDAASADTGAEARPHQAGDGARYRASAAKHALGEQEKQVAWAARSAPESGGLEALPEDGHGPALQGAVTSAELRSAELWVEEEEQVYDRPRTAANGIGNPAAVQGEGTLQRNREKLFSALQHSAKVDLRKFMKTRAFKCPHCERAYTKEDSLVVHVRLQHSGGASANTAGNAMVSGKPQQTGSTSLEEKLRRDRKWMPQAKVVIPSASTMNSVCGGSSEALGPFLVTAGADKRVTIRSLDESSHIIRSISCNSTINAVCVSKDGRVLAYGTRLGTVTLYDLASGTTLQHQLPERRDGKVGRVCALWLSPDASRLVVCTDKWLQTWGHQRVRQVSSKSFKKSFGGNAWPDRRVTPDPSDTETSGDGWKLMYQFDTPSLSNRFSGQHSLCGVETSFSWPGLEQGQILMAVGEKDSVTLWSLESGEVLLELRDVMQTCNCVWLTPDAKQLVTAGGSNKIMVWGLPDLALVHVFPCASRVWALWGDSKILASAGADSMVTLRSIETGAILSRLKRPGHVFALWGPPDGTMIASAGKSEDAVGSIRPSLRNPTPTRQLWEHGTITLRDLRPKQVLFRCEGLHDAETKCMWSDGKLCACAGLEFVTVVGVESGKIIADFTLKTIITGVWCFELREGLVVVMAFNKNVIAMKIETGETVREWNFEASVQTIHGDNVGNRLIVAGKWGLAILHLSNMSAEPTYVESLWGYALEQQMNSAGTDQVFSSKTGQKGALKVRCMWMPSDGSILAYAINDVIIIRSLEDEDYNGDYVALNAPDKISSMWGSSDKRILVSGHYSEGIIIVWCLLSGKELRRIDCGGNVKSVSGFGRLIGNALEPLTIVAGTDKAVNGIRFWTVKLSKLSLQAQKMSIERSQSYSRSVRSGSLWSLGHAGLDIIPPLASDEVIVESSTRFPTQNGVNCLVVSEDGSTLCVGGREKCISFYRLDTLHLCGPSLMMLKRSSDPCLDISQYNSHLGPLLMEGTLMEWLLKSEQDMALDTLLQHRPGAALLPLPDGTSTFDMAIRLRRSTILAKLLEAVVRFTIEGEGQISMHGGNPESDAVSSIQNSAFWRLPSPALRRVTDCLNLALKSKDMTEVIKRFLDELPMLHLDYFSATDLPFVASQQFLGSSSSSGLTPGRAQDCIWRTDYKQVDQWHGFPAMAHVVMLPGLTNSSLLSLLARQKPDILYTPPIRTLLDAMRHNGIQTRFYTQFALFTALVLSFTLFVAAVVDLPNGNAGRVSWVLRAGALLVSDTCQDRSLSQSPWFFLCMGCGCISVIMCGYYFYREINELFDFGEDDDEDKEHDQADEMPSRASWQDRLYKNGGISVWETDAPVLQFDRETRHETHRESHFDRDESRRYRIILSQNNKSRSGEDIQGISDTPPEGKSTMVARVAHEASYISIDEERRRGKLKSAALTVSSTLRMRRLLAKSPSFASAGSGSTTNFFEERPSCLSIVYEILASCVESISKTIRKVAARSKINLSYFKSFWNWMVLIQFALIWGTFISFILAWTACSESICTEKSDAEGGTPRASTGSEGVAENAATLQCRQAITHVRLFASLGVPAMYTYSLYYFRCFDSLNFYVRIIFVIIADMRYFLFIMLWLLFAFSTGMFALQCHEMEDSRTPMMSILYLFHSIALSAFDPSLEVVDGEDLGCGLDSRERKVTYFLFWGIIFFFVLIMLNALIAIMNNSYQTLQDTWHEQIKKTWAEITADIISNWPDSQRAQWEKKFYWLHLVGPNHMKPGSDTENTHVHAERTLGGVKEINRAAQTLLVLPKQIGDMEERLSNLMKKVELDLMQGRAHTHSHTHATTHHTPT